MSSPRLMKQPSSVTSVKLGYRNRVGFASIASYLVRLVLSVFPGFRLCFSCLYRTTSLYLRYLRSKLPFTLRSVFSHLRATNVVLWSAYIGQLHVQHMPMETKGSCSNCYPRKAAYLPARSGPLYGKERQRGRNYSYWTTR